MEPKNEIKILELKNIVYMQYLDAKNLNKTLTHFQKALKMVKNFWPRKNEIGRYREFLSKKALHLKLTWSKPLFDRIFGWFQNIFRRKQYL